MTARDADPPDGRDPAPFPGEGALASVGLLGLCAVVAYSVMTPIADFDFGWHVALGRYVVETRSLPTTEPFTHTAVGAPEVPHQWLSEVLYYLVVQAAGVLGLRWVHAGVTVAVLLALFLLLRREGVTPALSLFGTFAYVVVAQGRFQTRPLLFDLLCLVLAYGIAFVLRPRLTGRQLALLFVGLVVWANLHSGAVLFAGLASLYAAVETAQQALRRRERRADDLGGGELRRLWALAGLSAAACLATPNHVRLISYVWQTRALNAAYSDEWQSIAKYWGDPMMTPFAVEGFWLLLAAAALTAVLAGRARSLAPTAVALVLAALPLLGERFLSVAFAPVLLVLGEGCRWARTSGRARLLAGASVAGVLGLAVAVHPVMNRGGLLERFSGRLTAEWNFAPAEFPIGAVRVLEATRLKGRLYNPSAWGGYVLLRTYRDYPVFIDGRWLSVGEKVLADSIEILRRGPNAFALLDEYRIDLALLPRDWMTPELARERGWLPIFENYNSGLYLRNSAETAQDRERVAAYYRERGVPFDPERGFVERAALEASPAWAAELRVERHHLTPDRRVVAGW